MSEEADALFRYRTIAPLCDPDLAWGEKTALMEEIASRIHVLPNGHQRAFKFDTIKSWYKRYKKSGYEGLVTAPRSDKGTFRVVDETVIQKACDLKREQPRRTLNQIIAILEQEEIVPVGKLQKSVLHRIFGHHQLTARIPKSKGYWKRYQAQYSNDLWQSDQMHGPEVTDPHNPHKTISAQLLAWIDDHSRLICHAQFYPKGKLTNLEHALKKSIQKMGVPKMIYVDNGSIYASKHLGEVCAKVGTRLIHATPYQPEGKGKIEKFFGYVRSSFMPEVEVSSIRTLEQLNEAFWAWLELKYQKKEHTQIKTTPMAAFLNHKARIRRLSLAEIRGAFLYREKRKVHKDCTFQLAGNYYEVMPALVKQEIEVQYDLENLDEVKVYLAGSFFQQAKLLRVPPRRPKKVIEKDQTVNTGIDYLSGLVESHKSQQSESIFGPIAGKSKEEITSLIFMFKNLGFCLSKFEQEIIDHYDRTLPGIDRRELPRFLETMVRMKGNKHHVQVYLDQLNEIIAQGGHLS
jgi:putative transposase